jgi:hypothetical protein
MVTTVRTLVIVLVTHSQDPVQSTMYKYEDLGNVDVPKESSSELLLLQLLRSLVVALGDLGRFWEP